MSTRIKHLENKYAAIEAQIGALMKTGDTSTARLTQLREQKLQIASELSQLRKQKWNNDHEYVNLDDE